MPDNIYKFRRLKWGDPETKLNMLGQTESPAPRRSLNWDVVGIVVGLAIIGLLLILIFKPS